MTDLQRLELRMGDLRKQLAELIGATEPDTTAIETLTGEIRATDALLVAQKVLAPEAKPEVTTTAETAEERALVELRSNVQFGRYVSAALAGMPVMGGAELELNQHLNIAANFFPLELLAGGEHRALRDGDGEGNQGTWLDRIVAETAAARLGVTFPMVPAGVAAYPVMSAGASGVQRGRTEAVAEGTYTVAVTELKPTRNAVYGIYSIEDELRLPGLSEAIIRDMRAATLESIDKAVFIGDAGANEAGADIAGLTTAAGVVEKTITQAKLGQGRRTAEGLLGLR